MKYITYISFIIQAFVTLTFEMDLKSILFHA